MKEKKALIVKDDHICPIAKTYCDNECCPVGSICNISSIIEDGISDTLPQKTRTMKTAVEKLIAKYNKQWNKYGMGSVVAYSQVVADLEKLLDNISDEEIIAETFKQQEQ